MPHSPRLPKPGREQVGMHVDDLGGGEHVGYRGFQRIWRNHQINIVT